MRWRARRRRARRRAGALPGEPGEALIEARGLRKQFGDFVAVDGIDVTVTRGEAFGFLGPNGAGKSSTMRMVGLRVAAVGRRPADPRARPAP